MGAGVLRKIVGHAPGSKSAIVSAVIEAQKADVHTENNKLRRDVVDVAVPHRKKYNNFLGHKITNTTKARKEFPESRATHCMSNRIIMKPTSKAAWDSLFTKSCGGTPMVTNDLV